MMDEFAATDRALTSVTPSDAGARAAANASIFRERGLSSDTSILSDYGVATALQAIRDQGLRAARGPGRHRRTGTRLHQQGRWVRLLPPADDSAVRPHRHAAAHRACRAHAAADDIRHQQSCERAHQDRIRASHICERVQSSHCRSTKTRHGRSTSAYWKTLGGTIGEEIAAARVPVAAGNVLVRSVRVPGRRSCARSRRAI